MEINFNIKLSDSQKEIHDLAHNDEFKFLTVVMSRQSGKTVLMMVLCIEWLCQKGNTIAYICRNFTLAKKLFRELVKLFPKELTFSSNGTDFFIQSIFGSTLNFYSSEQGSSLRGQTFTHMVCDEFAFHKQEQPDGTHLWNDILSPTLKARGKKCIFVSTPLGKNIFYEMYLRGLSIDFPQYASIKKTIYNDGFITPEQIEEIRKSVPDATFRQEYLCEWMDDGVSFFQGFSDCFDIKKSTKANKCWVGVDCSANGKDATVASRVNELGEIDVFEAKGTLDMKYRQIAEWLNEWQPQAVYIEVNGLGAPMYNEIRKLVRRKNILREWTTTNTTKEDIVSNLAVAIANRQVHFLEDDEQTYNELANFVVTVSKTRKLTFAARGTFHDDRVMATAIALQCKEDNKSQAQLNFVNSNNTWIY